jgi:hypothetical protein
MPHRRHPGLRLALLALLGLLAAAALGAATSQITSQPVGLSGEPLSLGDELVAGPSSSRADAARQRRRLERRRAKRKARRAAEAAAAAAAPAPGVGAEPPAPSSASPPPAELPDENGEETEDGSGEDGERDDD